MKSLRYHTFLMALDAILFSALAAIKSTRQGFFCSFRRFPIIKYLKDKASPSASRLMNSRSNDYKLMLSKTLEPFSELPQFCLVHFTSSSKNTCCYCIPLGLSDTYIFCTKKSLYSVIFCNRGFF